MIREIRLLIIADDQGGNNARILFNGFTDTSDERHRRQFEFAKNRGKIHSLQTMDTDTQKMSQRNWFLRSHY
jgi:hypothetical protein